MSSRPKKKRYSLEEVEDMLMNDPDSGDSDLDLGEDFAALDIESNRDEESENDNNNNEMESEYEESDNEISFRSTANEENDNENEENEVIEATSPNDEGKFSNFFTLYYNTNTIKKLHS